MNINLQQSANLPSQSKLDNIGNWIMVLNYPLDLKKLAALPCIKLLQQRRKQAGRSKADKTPFVFNLPNEKGSRIASACITEKISSFDLLTLCRNLIAEHKKTGTIGLVVTGFPRQEQERICEGLISAALATAAKMPDYKSKQESDQPLRKLELFGNRFRHGFKRTFAEAEGNALARKLSMLPANKLTPTDYVKHVRKLAKENNWSMEFYGLDALKKKKAGAFIAVAQGSPARDAGIVRLTYKPVRKTSKGKVTLVGKGICYDTGGTNLKPANYMFGMHEDMQGSAVALGTFMALSTIKVDFPVECWMAIAMNHIGPNAYKPNDVVTAADGTTIEVVHTDAEGRMVLADTLALASRGKPALIIDYATLTGACIYSIGTAYSGVFTNREAWHSVLIKTGRESGERVWPFPLDEDYDKLIESSIADIKQCSRESGVDHILAARFLKHFVKDDIPWIHIDLSSSHHKGGLAHVPTPTTGFGIRFTLNLLLDQKLIIN